jgi:ABC-type molybdate transport system substrate-binding protein
MVTEQQAFGVCFYSSVFQRNDLKIIDKIPESAHKKIAYYAVVIAGDNMDEARNFLEYLKSAEVNKILRKYGFVVD